MAAANLQHESLDRVSVDELEQMAREAGIEPRHVRSAMGRLSAAEKPLPAQVAPGAVDSRAVGIDFANLGIIALAQTAFLSVLLYPFSVDISVVLSLTAAGVAGFTAEPNTKNAREGSRLFALVGGFAAFLWFALLHNRFQLFQNGAGPYDRLLVLVVLSIAGFLLVLGVRGFAGRRKRSRVSASRLNAV